MRAAGEHAWLYYDAVTRDVNDGDYIRTPTGRTYLIQGIRIQEKGKHAGRMHLSCIVMAADHVPEEDATVHPLHWYSRNRVR